MSKKKGSAKKVLATVLSLAIVGTAAGGVVAYNKNDKFKTKVNNIFKIEQSIENPKLDNSTGNTTSSTDSAELANLKQQLADVETEVDNLENQLASANTNIDTLEAEIEELEAQLETAGEEKAELEAQLEIKTQALVSAQAEKDSLESQLASANETIATLEEQLANASSSINYVKMSSELTDFKTNDYALTRSRIYTDGTDYFYNPMDSDKHYKLNLNTNEWEEYIFTCEIDTAIDPTMIFSDGKDIYYAYYSTYLKLDKANKHWSKITMTGLSQCQGKYCWFNGTNIYYSYSSYQYKLDTSTLKWTKITWSGLSSPTATNVWTDGTNFYHTNGGTHYKVDFSTNTWTTVTITGLPSTIQGSHIFYDGSNTYAVNSNVALKLNKDTMTFENITFNGYSSSMYGSNFIKINGQTYYFTGSDSYLFDGVSSLTRAYFKGSFDGNLSAIWNIGDETFYSYNDKQLKLNKNTNVFEPFEWGGLNNFRANYIWRNGNDIYLTVDSYTYKLDTTTYTWNIANEISGSMLISPANIWSFGDKIFSSNNYSHYEFNKETLSWESVTFTGLGTNGFNGSKIFVSGDYAYLILTSSYQYRLSLDSYEWEQIQISGYNLNNIDNIVIYKDYVLLLSGGCNFYFDSENMIFNSLLMKTDSIYYTGADFWTDGTNLYCSDGSSHQKIIIQS